MRRIISLLVILVLSTTLISCGNVEPKKVEPASNQQASVEVRENNKDYPYEYTISDGTKFIGVYNGEWQNELPSGKGTFTLTNDGTTIAGTWVEGIPNGQFVITWTDGSKHEGEMKNGLLNGHGIHTSADGTKVEGQWENGEFIPPAFKIGDTIEIGDILLTVNGVREGKGNQFLVPKEGNIFYIVDMTIENTGSDSYMSSTMMQMKVSDSDGYAYGIALYTDLKASVDGEIGAGRKVRGEAAFEIPKAATGLEFLYNYGIGSGQAIIKLDR